MKLSFMDLNNELMVLSSAKHALLIRAYDITRSEWVYRWFADAKAVGFRIPEEELDLGDRNDALNKLGDRFLRPALAMWAEDMAIPNPEAEFARLKSEALSSNLQYAEAWIEG